MTLTWSAPRQAYTQCQPSSFLLLPPGRKPKTSRLPAAKAIAQNMSQHLSCVCRQQQSRRKRSRRRTPHRHSTDEEGYRGRQAETMAVATTKAEAAFCWKGRPLLTNHKVISCFPARKLDILSREHSSQTLMASYRDNNNKNNNKAGLSERMRRERDCGGTLAGKLKVKIL